jgi:hypothetical protein
MVVSRIARQPGAASEVARGTKHAGLAGVAERTNDRDTDRVDVFVYVLWAAVLLVLLRVI